MPQNQKRTRTEEENGGEDAGRPEKRIQADEDIEISQDEMEDRQDAYSDGVLEMLHRMVGAIDSVSPANAVAMFAMLLPNVSEGDRVELAAEIKKEFGFVLHV